MSHSSGSKPRYRCFTKARRLDGPEHPTRSAGWVASRRGWLEVYDDRVECGSWSIAHDDVAEAVVYEVRQLGIRGGVLQLSTENEAYQFGVNPWARPWDHLPMAVRTESVRLGWSAFSVVVRLAALAVIVAWIVSRL